MNIKKYKEKQKLEVYRAKRSLVRSLIDERLGKLICFPDKETVDKKSDEVLELLAEEVMEIVEMFEDDEQYGPITTREFKILTGEYDENKD